MTVREGPGEEMVRANKATSGAAKINYHDQSQRKYCANFIVEKKVGSVVNGF